MNGQASPNGDQVNRDITVPPTFLPLNSGNDAQSPPDELVSKFQEFSLTQMEQQTLTPDSASTQSSQLGDTLTPPVQSKVMDPSQAQKMHEASRNLGPAHVPILETRLQHVDNPSARSQMEAESSHLSGFVSVKDKLYTPGSKLQHPHGPIAQPVSTVLGSESGRLATEGEDEETSLKRKAVDDFLHDLSLSNPDLLQTLMKNPESLENVLRYISNMSFATGKISNDMIP